MSSHRLVVSFSSNAQDTPAACFTSGVLCEQTVQQLAKDLSVLPVESGGRTLLLDLRGMKLVTARGLGALISLHKNLRIKGITLVICNVNTWPYEVFEITRLTKVLNVRRKEFYVEV